MMRPFQWDLFSKSHLYNNSIHAQLSCIGSCNALAARLEQENNIRSPMMWRREVQKQNRTFSAVSESRRDVEARVVDGGDKPIIIMFCTWERDEEIAILGRMQFNDLR